MSFLSDIYQKFIGIQVHEHLQKKFKYKTNMFRNWMQLCKVQLQFDVYKWLIRKIENIMQINLISRMGKQY